MSYEFLVGCVRGAAPHRFPLPWGEGQGEGIYNVSEANTFNSKLKTHNSKLPY